MKRYLHLGTTQVDVKWLFTDSKGATTTMHQMIDMRVYREMPDGWIGPAKGSIVSFEFAPIQLDVPAGQHLTIVPEGKMPDHIATFILENP